MRYISFVFNNLFLFVKKVCLLIASLCLISACSSFEERNPEEIVQNNEEFDDMVDVKPIESSEEGDEIVTKKEAEVKDAAPVKSPKKNELEKTNSKNNSISNTKKKKKVTKQKTKEKKETKKETIIQDKKVSKVKPSDEKSSVREKKETSQDLKRQPEVEGLFPYSERRPPLDPFRPGERVIHDVKYFGVAAGHMYLDVLPFVEVNGRKSYAFSLSLVSSRVFSMFYSVNDKVTTYVDFENLTPSTYRLEVKESGQIKDSRAFFDQDELIAKFWMKKWTKDKGHEDLKKEWDILPFSQNVFSAVFYMRTFPYEVGKNYGFRVADDGKNIFFKAKVIGKEVIETKAGKFNTVVLKPTIEVDGIFKPVGEIKLWLTDDDRKYLVRLESDIKIGTLVSEVTKIIPGKAF